MASENKIQRRTIQRGEALAILSESIHSGPNAMWWDFYGGAPLNTREGSIAVVHIRGSLNHHSGWCDSYEAILGRVAAAFSGEDVVAEAKKRSYWDESIEVPQVEPPSAVILRIDSPGGVCSGLNETVFALRRMSDKAAIPLIAYVDELAASAAYALACACSEIILPPSAIAGSIGVISGMYDQTEADKEMGIKFVTIKSGARKDDGHPHVPISDAAINAEQRRVDRLAKQFYAIVASARPLSAKEIESYQAGIFLGKEVVAKGLADAVMGWDEVIEALAETGSVKKPLAKVGQAESGVMSPSAPNGAKEKPPMSLVALNALVKRATAAVASEKDPEKKKALASTLATYTASLEAYKKEKHSKEVTETEEGDDPDDEKDGDDDEGDEEESAESSEESASADDEEKEKKAALSILGAGATDKAIDKLSKIVRKANAYDATRKDVAVLKKNAELSAKNEMIDEALGQGGKPVRITPAEAITLRGASTAEVKFFLSMRKGAIINTENGDLHRPNPDAKPGDGSGLSAEVLKQVDAAVAAAPDGVDRVKLRADMFAQHEKRMSAGLNGAGGRY